MIFVDTGAFLARYLKRDQYHQDAVEFWRRLHQSKERCFTTNLVLSETFTLLGRRAGYGFAAQRAGNIYASESLVILRSDLQQERAAIDLLEKFADQAVSFTDCVSFAVMRAHRIKRVFTFDAHFEKAGFLRFP